MDREKVIERWREIERELAIDWCGASAAERPGHALRKLAAQQQEAEGVEEASLTQLDRVSKILALSLCKRYGLRALRHAGQRRTTVVVEGPATFVAKVFWPLLDRGGQAVTDGVDSWLGGVVQACIYDDVPDDEEAR